MQITAKMMTILILQASVLCFANHHVVSSTIFGLQRDSGTLMAEFFEKINNNMLMKTSIAKAFSERKRRNSHSEDEAYVAQLSKPYLESDGVTMVFAGRKVNIVSPNFESMLSDILTRVTDQVKTMGDEAEQKRFLANFYENIFDFVNNILMPARYNAFNKGQVMDNQAIHKVHRILMRKVYTSLAQVDSPLVPSCWKTLFHEFSEKDKMKSSNQREDINMEELERIQRSWKELQCEEFDKSGPDDASSPSNTNDIDLMAPRFVSPRIVQIRGHRYLNVLDQKVTENAISRFYRCTTFKIAKVPSGKQRRCYNDTINLNMHNFYNELEKYTKNTDLVYRNLQNMVGERSKNDNNEVLNTEERFLRTLLMPSMEKNRTRMIIGDEELDVFSPTFEQKFYTAYARILRQLNSIEDTKLRKTLSVAFNENMYGFLNDQLMPARFNAFKNGEVESNSYLHIFARDLMRRQNMALAHVLSPRVPPCWKDLYKYLDQKPSETEQISLPLGWEVNKCDEFFIDSYPDVNVYALKADDIDLTAPRFVRSRKIQIRGHKLYRMEREKESENALLRFYKCMKMKISQLKNPNEKQCFLDTFILNMINFNNQLQTQIADSDFKYLRVRSALNSMQEDYIKQLQEEDNKYLQQKRDDSVKKAESNQKKKINVTKSTTEHRVDTTTSATSTLSPKAKKKRRIRTALLIVGVFCVLGIIAISFYFGLEMKRKKSLLIVDFAKKAKSFIKHPRKKKKKVPPEGGVPEEREKLLKPEPEAEDEMEKIFVDPPIYKMVPKLIVVEQRSNV